MIFEISVIGENEDAVSNISLNYYKYNFINTE